MMLHESGLDTQWQNDNPLQREPDDDEDIQETIMAMRARQRQRTAAAALGVDELRAGAVVRTADAPVEQATRRGAFYAEGDTEHEDGHIELRDKLVGHYAWCRDHNQLEWLKARRAASSSSSAN